MANSQTQTAYRITVVSKPLKPPSLHHSPRAPHEFNNRCCCERHRHLCEWTACVTWRISYMLLTWGAAAGHILNHSLKYARTLIRMSVYIHTYFGHLANAAFGGHYILCGTKLRLMRDVLCSHPPQNICT